MIERDNTFFINYRHTKGTHDGEWIAINFLTEQEPDKQYAFNNAYYLMAEMKKGEAEHSH